MSDILYIVAPMREGNQESDECEYALDYLEGRVKVGDTLEATLEVALPYRTEISAGKARICELKLSPRALYTEMRVEILQYFANIERIRVYYKGVLIHNASVLPGFNIAQGDILALYSDIHFARLSSYLRYAILWRRFVNWLSQKKTSAY